MELRAKKKFRCLYDYGDSWLYEITVSKVVPITDKDDELMYPHCIDGERAGPLEDSGGIWGYKSMLDILKDPNNENYAEIRERVGDFDPEYVNIEEINASLVKMFKPTPQKAPGHNSAIPIQNR